MTSSVHSCPISSLHGASEINYVPRKSDLMLIKSPLQSLTWLNGDQRSLLATHCCPPPLRSSSPRQPPTLGGFWLVEPTKRGGPQSPLYHIWNWRCSLIGEFWWTEASTSDIAATNGIFFFFGPCCIFFTVYGCICWFGTFCTFSGP